MTRLEQAEAEYARLRRDAAKIAGRLAVVRDALGPLRRAHRRYIERLWSQCWVVVNEDGRETSDPETAAEWRAHGTIKGAFWSALGLAAYAEKDAVLAQFQQDIRPHLDAERALKIELEIAERNRDAALRLVSRIKGNSTDGGNQHVMEWA